MNFFLNFNSFPQVMVLSHFFLKDPCNALRTACTFGLVAGVMLIFQPQDLIFASTHHHVRALKILWVNFTDILCTAFKPVDLKSAKRTDSIFCVLGIWGQFHQHLTIKFFCTKVLLVAFFYLHVTREKLQKRLSYEKFSCKMLMRLTPGHVKTAQKCR